jgi:AcrR family transcriptional regulator
MNTGTPVLTAADTDSESSTTIRSRDAGTTRQLLLEAARRRFAQDGYTATTVRDIATDAGVNVALINRYFSSKEGLFEACLATAAADLSTTDAADQTLDSILDTMVSQMSEPPTGDHQLQLMLLLRSSRDERADSIRRGTLESFAKRLAIAAGWKADDTDADQLLLRAQIVLSTTLGMVLLRSSTGVEPLDSASQDDLVGPLRDLLHALLGRHSVSD